MHTNMCIVGLRRTIGQCVNVNYCVIFDRCIYSLTHVDSHYAFPTPFVASCCDDLASYSPNAFILSTYDPVIQSSVDQKRC